MQGVAVVTRKGSFMAKKDVFLKNGFVLADKAEPDFELLVIKFNPQTYFILYLLLFSLRARTEIQTKKEYSIISL